jgi:hypothetical protein
MFRLFFKIHLPFLFFLFFSSCSCKDKYYNLTEEELKLLVYKEGDVVMFKNNYDEKDTLICDYSRSSYDSETAVGTTCSQTINKQRASSVINSKNFRLGIALKKVNNEIIITISFSIPNIEIPDRWNRILFIETKSGSELSTAVINNKEYKNVLLFEGEPNTDLRKLYYQKENGFLKFEMANGEIWEINK